VKRYPQYAPRSIYRHAKKHVGEAIFDKRRLNKGRPRKLTLRDERGIIRALKKLRNESVSFSSRRIKTEANVPEGVSCRNVRRFLNRKGYGYRQARKKGLLTEADKKKRAKFAKKIAKKLKEEFWTEGISFYFDGVGFVHKTNPHNEARSSGARNWRKAGEGLVYTSKGKKEGSGGKTANFFVAIAFDRGVISCEQYHSKLTGKMFAEFVTDHFSSVFENSANPRGKLFLQDGDPRQCSRVARKAMDQLGCRIFAIPPRSPDINPIENIFHLVRKQLQEDALRKKITKESFAAFSERIKRTMKSIPVETINKTILSMNKRMQLIIKGKGNRTKY
jgi:hypothetical protein